MLHGEDAGVGWEKIKPLYQSENEAKRLQMRDSLKKLTKPQMLLVARECCGELAKSSRNARLETVYAVAAILDSYSNEEGGLSDSDLRAMLEIIASPKELLVFREALLDLLREVHWRYLTDAQRQQSRQVMFDVALNKQTTPALREEGCWGLVLAISDEYHGILYRDKNVVQAREDDEKWRQLEKLIGSGEVKLEADTITALEALRKEMARISGVLLLPLSKDEKDAPGVRRWACGGLKEFGELPIPPEIRKKEEQEKAKSKDVEKGGKQPHGNDNDTASPPNTIKDSKTRDASK